MTVVLSVRCADGLVIASDSQITESARGMSYPAQKLHDMGDHAAWGGSGARSVLGDLERIFRDSASAIVESDDVGRALQERALPVMKHHYDNFIEHVPGEETAGTPSAYVLAAGYSGDVPWIIEVNPNGLVTHYEDIGFHAIGGGAPMAQQAGALLAHFDMSERDVRFGVVGALRVLDALGHTSPMVGPPFDICRITAEDGAHHLDEGEIAEVGDRLTRWNDLEGKALNKLFS